MADLREKLEKLVEEWLAEAKRDWDEDMGEYKTLRSCAVELTAILAESESAEQCNCDGPFSGDHQHWPVPILVDESHPAQTNPGRTHYVGDDCEGGHAEMGKLPLGHEFVGHSNGPERTCTLYGQCHYLGEGGLCGQPRAAHEPKACGECGHPRCQGGCHA